MTRPKILIIDDDPAIREIAVEFLNMAGFESREASSVAEVEKIAAEGGRWIVLVDWTLADGDASDALAVIKNAPDFQMDGVILVSGREDPPAIDVDAVIRKPFDLDDLLSAVEALEKKSGAME